MKNPMCSLICYLYEFNIEKELYTIPVTEYGDFTYSSWDPNSETG